MAKFIVSEDRIRGRRVVLKNGALVVEKVEPLPPEQVAMLADAVANAVAGEDVEAITTKRD